MHRPALDDPNRLLKFFSSSAAAIIPLAVVYGLVLTTGCGGSVKSALPAARAAADENSPEPKPAASRSQTNENTVRSSTKQDEPHFDSPISESSDRIMEPVALNQAASEPATVQKADVAGPVHPVADAGVIERRAISDSWVLDHNSTYERGGPSPVLGSPKQASQGSESPRRRPSRP